MSNWDEYKQTMALQPTLWSAARGNDPAGLARLLAEGASSTATAAPGTTISPIASTRWARLKPRRSRPMSWRAQSTATTTTAATRTTIRKRAISSG